MRNLRTIHRSFLKCQSGEELTAVAVDTASASVICAFGPTKDNTLIELRRWNGRDKKSQPIASWDAPCPLPSLNCDKILDLRYFSDSSTACLVLAGGDIVVVREEIQAGEDKIEIVGSVDAGISAASWSPDEELLAITSNAATLLYMTRDFDNVTNIPFDIDDLKASNHVTVGWGKKETQFKGKKARALRDPTMPEMVDEGVLSENDLKETSISWRGDGAYLAVNSIQSDTRRVIRVYSREGVLDSVSEPVDGLVGALSWRPAGNLLAGVQYRDSLVQVVFFERNGLRHGQFDLRLSKEEIQTWGSRISVQWNIDSSILAVCYNDRVQLWTMGNYHYYLKQEIFAPSKGSLGGPVAIRWHPEKPLQLVFSSEDGVQNLVYSSNTCCGPTTPPHDYGIVAVIDGRCLKVTPIRLTNVPPPMALHEITLEHNAIDVAITVNHQNAPSVWIAVLHREGCSLYEWPLTSLVYERPTHKWTTNPTPNGKYPELMFLQVAFCAETSAQESVLLVSHDAETSKLWVVDQIGQLQGEMLSLDEVINGVIPNRPCLSPETYIFTDTHGNGTNEALNKRIAEYKQYNRLSLLAPPFVIKAADTVRYSQVMSTSTNGTPFHKDFFFSLTDKGSLYADQRLLARNCTSFLVTPAHLIFTTSLHLLKFVHMTESSEAFDVPPDTPESDERCRNIERGAKLVTVMPSIFALVMQMPRGNLETIYPRALVLVGIRISINEQKYKKAFLACRNHRVDMNILHDHAPQQFISNVSLFLNQVQKVEHIDLFLSQLREEDVSETMYKDTKRWTSRSEPPIHQIDEVSTSKVNRICNAFLEALGNRTSTHLQNVITAHVCKIPPNLNAGLRQIATLRSTNPDVVDGAIEHICFLADVNRLFDNALGLYDLELALLVAQQSQKDPKEYLPFLQNLQREPLLRRKYCIDNHLGRFQKALKHLIEMDAFDEVKAYTAKHDLYQDSLDFYRYQEAKLHDITRLYADHLLQKSEYKSAGIAFEYLNNYPSATDAFRQAHLWKESLACATLIPLPPPQLQSLAQGLADILSESKEFFSAATIHLDYLSDIPTASRIFCKGYHFATALRIVGLHHRPELLESIIDPGLIDGMASITELLADCKAQLNAQIPRLRELRAKKAEDPLAFFDGDVNDGADIPDNVSVTPTDASTIGGSLFTRYTNRTGTVSTNATRRSSKNRRKEERKRARGKKGSIYEEEYLVNSVGRLIDRVNAVNDEVERLVVGLMRRGMRERAKAVENAMVDVVEICKGCIGEVFGEKVNRADGGFGAAKIGNGEMDGKERLKGGDSLILDAIEDQKQREMPVVKGFSRLSLLGR